MSNPSTLEKSGVSRRTVIKGAAWSVPVIAAAVAVPMAAASETPTTTPRSVGYIVESSDAISDTSIRVSSARLEDPKANEEIPAHKAKPFNTEMSFTYVGGDAGFSFLSTTLAPGTSAWKIDAAQTTATRIVFKSTAPMQLGYYLSLPPLMANFNLPVGVKPFVNSISTGFSATSVDGKHQIDGIVAALHDLSPVIGPRNPDTPAV